MIARACAGCLAAVLAVGVAAPAGAQDRPSEGELFGAPAPQPKADAPAPEPSSPLPARPSEAEVFGGTGSPSALPPPPERLVARERDDWLKIGGQLYLRLATTWQDGMDVADWPLASPNLLDLYADARPNDRVRAFVLGRMSYDPTRDGANEDPTLADLVGATPAANPQAVLDQLWINFDVARRVFVTAGKQHVKWGVGHFWNPTDWLHAQRRDPLAVFDPRTGTTMVKLHVPWEARGWNAYGILSVDDTGARPVATRRLGRVGAGGRAEIVVGTLELGVDALVRDGRRPRIGADVSFGIWELDLYAEVALRRGAEVDRWRLGSSGLERIRYDRLTPQAVGGASWSRKYSDEDVVTLGVEYSYDDTGYDSSAIYPWLLAVPYLVPGEPSPFTPFYLARHQAGAYVSLPSPGSWNDTTFTLSALSNLSDGSWIVRLDHSVLALTYLRVETYVAGHFGERGGVYRFAVDPSLLGLLPAETRGSLGPIDRPPVLDVGIALRVAL